MKSVPRLLPLALLLVAPFATAQTWNGAGADNSIFTAGNWVGGAAPANDFSAALLFAGSTRLAPDFGSDVGQFQQITFSSTAGAFTLQGSNEVRLMLGIVMDSTAADQSMSPMAGLLGGASLSGSAGSGRTLTLGALGVDGNFNQNAITKTGDWQLVVTGQTVLNDGGLSLQGGTFTVGSGGTTGELIGDVAAASGTTVRFNRADNSSFSGGISGAGDFEKTGAGTLFVTGVNSFTGATTVSGGTLRLDGAGALSASTAVTLSSAGSLVVAGSNTVASLNATGSGTVDIASGRTLTLAGSGDSTISSLVTGAGALAKSGSGRLTLSGDNTFSGGLTVSGGTLYVSNTTGSAVGHGGVSIGSGATLAGTGIMAGTVSLASGATLSPGASPGNLTLANLTLSGGSTFRFEINDADGVAGTNWDFVTVANTLTLGGTTANPITFHIASLQSDNSAGAVPNFQSGASYSWQFASYGSLSGFDPAAFSIVTTDFANAFTGTFSLSQSGSGLFLNYTAASAVPEPATCALAAGVGGLGLAFAARRWRRKDATRLPPT